MVWGENYLFYMLITYNVGKIVYNYVDKKILKDEKTYEQIKEELDLYKDEFNRIYDENINLINENKKLKQENEELEICYNDLEMKNKELEQYIADTEADIWNLNRELNNEKDYIMILEKENQERKIETLKLRKQKS